MRKIIYGLGIFAAIAIVGIAIGIGYIAYVGTGLDRQSKQYVDDAVPAITSNWSISELRRRATPQLLKSAKPEDLQTLFEWFATLGPLIEYEGSKGESNMSAMIGRGTIVSARYLARARFAKGGAEIEVGLLKVDGAWQISAFRVNSTVLITNSVGRKT
jgi:hypothetical protein